MVTEGNQLLRLKKVDTVLLRSDLARVDTQWSELLTRIPVVQEKLHQVPSHSPNKLSCFSGIVSFFLITAVHFHISKLTGLNSVLFIPDPDGEVGFPSRHFRAVQLDIFDGECHRGG